MKKCPQCAQVYADDLNFCLTDGTTLVGGVDEFQSEAPTVVAGGGFTVPTSAPPPTQATFQPSPSFQPSAPAVEAPAPRRTGLWVAVGLATVLLVLGGVGILGFALYGFSGTGERVEANRKTPAASPSATSTATPSNSNDDALKREREKLEKDRKKLENERKELEKQKKEMADGDVEEELATARIIDPPTNIRDRPNGPVQCVIRDKRDITILGATGVVDDNGSWYFTDACGREGVVHSSQIRF